MCSAHLFGEIWYVVHLGRGFVIQGVSNSSESPVVTDCIKYIPVVRPLIGGLYSKVYCKVLFCCVFVLNCQYKLVSLFYVHSSSEVMTIESNMVNT